MFNSLNNKNKNEKNYLDDKVDRIFEQIKKDKDNNEIFHDKYMVIFIMGSTENTNDIPTTKMLKSCKTMEEASIYQSWFVKEQISLHGKFDGEMWIFLNKNTVFN